MGAVSCRRDGLSPASRWATIRLMPCDEALAARIRELVASEPGIVERRMFGGLAFLVDGKMSVGASGSGGLMVRVAPEQTDALLDRHQPHAEPFIMRGRPITGWLRVSAEGVRTRRQLEPWVTRSVAYARSLPAKS
jgi:TfoX/Sxy family transcriptional regulator of competence genes